MWCVIQALELETPFTAELLVKCNVDSILEGLALRIPNSGSSGIVVQVRSISDRQRFRISTYHNEFVIFSRNKM